MRRNGASCIPALALAVLTVVIPTSGWWSPAGARVDRSPILTFEGSTMASLLADWSGRPGGPPGTLFLDSTVVHQGRHAGRLERSAESPSTFSSFALPLPVDFTGDTLELRGWLKLDGVATRAGLWQRQDGRTGMLAFENMDDRPLQGTADWKEYSVRLPLDPKAKEINVGALLVGTGRLWVDDLQLFVDGKPLASVPEVVAAPTAIDTDKEFDGGSKIALDQVTPLQVENLALLGRVWGYLKYHHPAAVTGKLHWDYELFRVMPRVLAAPDRAGAQAVLAGWIAGLGEVPPCQPCAELPPGRPIAPPLEWLKDRDLLGADLSSRLLAIHAARPAVPEQFWVTTQGTVGNASFAAELPYVSLVEPDAGYRLLALFRYWNIIDYWYPYRDVIGEEWERVLPDCIPRFVAARTRQEYQLAMLSVITRVNDTHANLWSSLDVLPPRGKARLPVSVRFVEDRVIVTGYTNPRLGPASGLEVGDAIVAIDGVDADTLVNRWRPWYAASNEPTRRRDLALRFSRGEPGPVKLGVVRDDRRLDLDAARVPPDSVDGRAGFLHDHPGPTCRRLSTELAYLKLSTVKAAEVPSYLETIAGAKCLLIDIRNYPSEFMVFTLGNHLVRESTPFALFTKPDASNPGSFDWTLPVLLTPEAPYLEGDVAILVDEVSQSQAEYTTMAFRTRPGAVVVGSTTAGADGNVSSIPLPGKLQTMISGIGVFYPDRRPTQRIGIVPDLVVRPTIAGIKAGRDEVLEAAAQRMLGREMTAEERMALNSDGSK